MVIKPDVAVQRDLQLFPRSEMMALKYLLDPTVEAFDHAVCLGRFRRGEAVLDGELGAELVELVLARCSTLAQAKEAISELFSVVCKDRADADRAGTLQVAQEAPGIRRSLCLEDADENPSCCAVDGHEEVAPRRLVGHLGQILHVDVDVAGLVSLEAAVLGPRRLGLQVTQVADAVSAKAAVEPRARHVRVQEFPHHRQQVIERHKKRPAQRHGHSLLRGRQCGLKPMRRMAAIFNASALTPFPYSLLRRPVAFRENPGGFIAGLYRRPDLRRRRCLAVKLDQHVALPSRASVRTQRAMKSADRRGAM